MKRPLLIYGVMLTVGGWLLSRFGIMTYYPEVESNARAGSLTQLWAGLTTAQKLTITGLEVPCFTGVVLVLVFVALSRLVTRENSTR